MYKSCYKNSVMSCPTFLLIIFIFQGGFPDSPNCNDIVVSRDRTLSEAEGDIVQGANNYSIDNHKFRDDGVHSKWQIPHKINKGNGKGNESSNEL